MLFVVALVFISEKKVNVFAGFGILILGLLFEFVIEPKDWS